MSGTGAIGEFSIGISPIGGTYVPPPSGGGSQALPPWSTVGSGPSTSLTTITGTLTTFAPTTTAVFTFKATFDGALYTVSCPWNVYRQNWYVQIVSSTGTMIVITPLIGSLRPAGNVVELI